MHLTSIETYLFDLDGTLLDTAPDMCAAVNRLRREHDLEPVDLDVVRPFVSRGSRGVLGIAMPSPESEDQYALWQQKFLDYYEADIADNTTLFPGFEELLSNIEASGRAWGVVTNKPYWLAEPLMRKLGLLERCGVLIGGDSLAERKPHPLPVTYAMQRLGGAAHSTVMVGDDERDVASGKAANVYTIAVGYGYNPPGEDPTQWGADLFIAEPEELAAALATQPSRNCV